MIERVPKVSAINMATFIVLRHPVTTLNMATSEMLLHKQVSLEPQWILSGNLVSQP